MKRIILIALLLPCFINAQVIISNDTTVCGNFNDTLYALSATQSSMQTDDLHDDLVSIGFTFNFYGTPYTECVVSGNGYVTFDTSLANSYSPYSINAPVPNPGNIPENAILAPWQDINTGVTGNIYYGTTGIAPNRMFTVTWCEIAMFSCTADLHTSQVVLHEGSDKIEMFIAEKPLCAAWNGGAAIQGLVSDASTFADIVFDPILLADRNYPLQWTATNEGWEFLTAGSSAYVINQIPFIPIVAGEAIWTSASGDTLGYGPTLPVNISSTTVYYADVVGSCSSGILSDQVTVSVSGCFAIVLSSSDASCQGNDGQVSVDPGINTPSPYDMLLLDMNGVILQSNLNVSSSQTFSNLFPGTYVARVTDAGGSSSQDTIVVMQANNPLNVSSFANNVNCYNGQDGQISILADSGALPYSFYLNGVLNTNPIPYDSVFSNLSEGVYIVSVLDDNSCLFRDTINLTSPQYTLQSLAQSKVVICNGSNDGIAIGSGAGGTPPYSYEWFNQNFVSFSTNDTAFNLSAGSYYLEVSDANGCDTFSTVQVIAPQTALSGSPQVFGIACRGDSTGMIIGDANGSWAPYQYYWISSAGDTLQSTSYTTTRDTLKDLSSGVYTLHVYDAQSCFVSYSLNVGEPMTMLSIDSILVVENIACFGDSVGKARLFASGGMPNYSYMWDNGETGLVAQNLSAGYRHLTLTDDWGCEVVDSVYISENPEIQSTISVVQTVSCYGQSDGIASISSVGGIPTYTYFWSNGHTGLSMPDTSSGLVEGSYYVTTRDVIGCEVVDSVYVSEPEPLSMIANELVWISCFGANDGLAYASGLGGNLPYTFTWMTNGQIGDTINTVHPGLHTVEVVDARGCTSSDTIFMHEPTELHVNIDDNFTILAYCIGVNSASLTSLATGGTPGYSYAWDDNLVAPQLTATASHLLAGVYTVTATDSRGCTASDSRDIDTITNTMSAFVLEIDNVSCFGYNNGSAVVNASGAHAPYSYQWFGPNGYSSVNDSVANLYAENYSVTVSDTNNCMVNTSINLSEPAAITYNTLSSTDAVCLGSCDGSVLLDFTGGSAPYYGHALDNNTGAVTMNLLSDSLFSGICAGNYTVSLTDANDCPSYLVNGGNNQHDITALDTIFTALSSNGNMILCYGDATASLSIDLNYFNNTYSYSWENVLSPGVSLGAGSSLVGLESGTYVLLANYMTCHASDTMTITEPDSLTILGNVVDADCYGASTGFITTNVSGGSLGYVYNWSGSSSTNNNLNNVSAGVYTLTVSDMYSCEYSQTFVVGEPQEITATINQNSSNTYLLESNNVNGGVAPYVHSWREASAPNVQLATGTTYTVSSYGDYFVRVTDAQGCTSESNSIEFISTTINEVGSSLEVSVYPNPFRSEAVVDFGRVVESASLTIVDMYGKVIERHLVGNSDRYIITNKDKASGVYFLKIETRDLSYNSKIIIK